MSAQLVEHAVWKGEDIQHVTWKDDETDSISESDEEVDSEIPERRWSWSPSASSDEEVPYAKTHTRSEPDVSSQRFDCAHSVSSQGSVNSSDADASDSEAHGELSAKSKGSEESWTDVPPASSEPMSGISPYSSESMHGMHSMSSDEHPNKGPETMSSWIPDMLEEQEEGTRRHGRSRPCKGKRRRYRKLILKLIEEVNKDPYGFDFESLALPPSVALQSKAKEKLAKIMKEHVDRARFERWI